MLSTRHAMNAFFVRVPWAAELELRLNAGVKKHIGLQVLKKLELSSTAKQ